LSILAMHQINFLPWLGFFHKMARSDVFVLLDNVQVPQGSSYASRTKIKVPTGVHWLSLPIQRNGLHRYRTQKLAGDCFLGDVAGTLYHNYARAPYWNYHRFLSELKWAALNCGSLAEINGCLIGWAVEVLGIDTKIVLQSELSDRRAMDKQHLPIWLCKRMGCSTYLSGQGARTYNDPERFRAEGIELRYQEFDCPEYPQLWGEFVPNLSIVDLVFNCGSEAADVLGGVT
jgi:hypothetical protein